MSEKYEKDGTIYEKTTFGPDREIGKIESGIGGEWIKTPTGGYGGDVKTPLSGSEIKVTEDSWNDKGYTLSEKPLDSSNHGWDYKEFDNSKSHSSSSKSKSNTSSSENIGKYIDNNTSDSDTSCDSTSDDSDGSYRNSSYQVNSQYSNKHYYSSVQNDSNKSKRIATTIGIMFTLISVVALIFLLVKGEKTNNNSSELEANIRFSGSNLYFTKPIILNAGRFYEISWDDRSARPYELVVNGIRYKTINYDMEKNRGMTTGMNDAEISIEYPWKLRIDKQITIQMGFTMLTNYSIMDMTGKLRNIDVNFGGDLYNRLTQRR